MPAELRALVLLLCLATGITACATPSPPTNPNDLCAIFTEKRHWYKVAKRSARRWGIPVEVLMATMYQESAFKARARPPRGKRILWIFPGRRLSDSLGYSQALSGTWQMYRDSGNARLLNSRSSFVDSVDFIGWYHNQSVRRLKLQPNDATRLYLAYHEGWGGYERGHWKSKVKRWLRLTSTKLQQRADRYQQQLQGCRTLRRRWFFGLF